MFPGLDSLPAEAYKENVVKTAESLKLEDGSYTVEVRLEGGSGRAEVESPASLTVEKGTGQRNDCMEQSKL